MSLPLGLHPSPLGHSSFSTRGFYPSPLGPSSFSTWAFSLYLASFMILISYDHLNFSRASVVQFRVSRYVMRLNRTSELKVMTIWISRELLLFNFKRLDILCARIGPPCETLWPFEFLESFRRSISSVTIYYAPESDVRVKRYDHLISRELPYFNFKRLDMWCVWIGPLSETLWPFEFLESFRCYISSFSIYCVIEPDIRVKSYDHLNFSRASVV